MLHLQIPGRNEENLLQYLLQESIDAHSGGGFFAWTNDAGATIFFDDPIMNKFLKNSNFNLTIGTDLITDVKAVDKLTKLTNVNKNLKVKAFINNSPSIFHPKFAWFEHEEYFSLIVGSGNLTKSGLLSSWEAFTLNKIKIEKAAEVRDRISVFEESLKADLYDPQDQIVIDRVKLNSGSELGLRSRNPSIPQLPNGLIDSSDPVLVAEIPASSTRWKQANFDKRSYEDFFGARVGTQRRIVLRGIAADGRVGEIESRPSVEVKSQNYRFELALASGIDYPSNGAPIGVFVRRELGDFLYSLFFPGDIEYEPLTKFFDISWSGNSKNKKRVTTTVNLIKNSIPEAEIWKKGSLD
ncbi:MAG: phospholipase D family protein [Glutamicibacter ardleyensis]